MSHSEKVEDKVNKKVKPLKQLKEDNDDINVVKDKKNNTIDAPDIEKKVEVVDKKKKVVGRVNKDELFKKEQNEILEKFHKIVGFNGNVAVFYIEDINEEKRKAIDNLAEDIRKFYKSTVWKCANNEDSDKVWILLIKNVYKYSGFKVTQFSDKKIEKGVITRKARIIIETENN